MPERVIIYDQTTGALLSKDVASGHIGSGQLGPHIAAAGVLSAHVASGALGPHVAAQAILSAQQGSGQIGGVHFNPNDVWPGRVLSGIISSRASANFNVSGAAYSSTPGIQIIAAGSGDVGMRIIGMRDQSEFINFQRYDYPTLTETFSIATTGMDMAIRLKQRDLQILNASGNIIFSFAFNRNADVYIDPTIAGTGGVDIRGYVINKSANVLGQVAFRDEVFCQSGWGYLLPYDLRSGFVSGDIVNSGQMAFRAMSAKLDVRLWDGAQHWQGSIALTSSA